MSDAQTGTPNATPGTVSGSDFRRAVAPARDAVVALCDAADRVATAGGWRAPGVGSKAMSEIAAQAQWSHRSRWPTPVDDTHTFGAMTLVACLDYSRGFAQLLNGDRAPVYSHLVLARAVLETAVVASWLNDPRLDLDERIRRGLCEQLYSAKELKRLGALEDADARVQRWRIIAGELGWSISKHTKPKIGADTQRPSVADGITQLISGDVGDSSIGRTLWGYLSAVSHGTWYGLHQAFLHTHDHDGDAGMTLVAYGTSCQAVLTYTVCVLAALTQATEQRAVLMGWSTPEWEAAASVSRQAQLRLTKVNSPSPASPT